MRILLVPAVTLLLITSSVVGAAEKSASLLLYVGEARVLNEPDIRRMAVGNGRVLDVKILGTQQLLILAETDGQSTIHLWHRDGTENDYSVNVVPADTGRLLSEVRAVIGDNPNIVARVVGDKIILDGQDLNSEEASRLAEIEKRYPQVVNLISHVGMERMVETDVRIMEFKKSTLTQLGIQWQNTNITGPNVGVVGSVVKGTGFASVPFSASFGIQTAITSAINIAVNKGDAVALSEPRLICKSGGSSKFLAGGEVPIPLVGSFGETSVQFKPYGVKLEVEPEVSNSGVIHLKAFTELSAIDKSVSVDGIPGFITRRTETEVNLRADETLVISGLFDGSSNRTLDKVPGIADIPVLGELFKSRDFQHNRTELVMFLTPHIVSADSAGNREALKLGEKQRAEAVTRSNLAE
jgi:pilus assembly protein CpaC